MALDIKTGTHAASFPTKVASMMGQYGHVYNMVLSADHDNGNLIGRGAYVSFDQYAEAAVPTGFAGRINEQAADGKWLIEVTALGAGETLYVYNSATSPYTERSLRNEKLFYNADGDVVQGATLIVGDVIAVSAVGITGTPAAKTAVTYNATTKTYEI